MWIATICNWILQHGSKTICQTSHISKFVVVMSVIRNIAVIVDSITCYLSPQGETSFYSKYGGIHVIYVK